MRFWIGFIVIVTISSLAYTLILEKKAYSDVHHKIARNITEIVSVLLIGLSGYSIYFKQVERFIKNLWMSIYLGSSLFLFCFFVIDNFIYAIEKNGQHGFGSLKILLISPIIYLVIVLIKKLLDNGKPTINS
jgi:hypothetical protein